MPHDTSEKPTTLEDLTAMVARGFEQTATKENLEALRTHMEQRFEKVDQRLEQLEVNNLHMTETLNLIHHDTADLPAIREELDTLRQRVARLEAKLGLAA